jgi:hypothetical protein
MNGLEPSNVYSQDGVWRHGRITLIVMVLVSGPW